jgi:hypothetical protein
MVTESDDEGRQYIEDVMHEEKNIRHGCKLSKAFGSILGDIGLCMTHLRREELFHLGNYSLNFSQKVPEI